MDKSDQIPVALPPSKPLRGPFIVTAPLSPPRTRPRRHHSRPLEHPHSLIPLISQTHPTPCTVSRSALIHMNLHALLCESEVIGWLAGVADEEQVRIVKAFPVKAQGETENPNMNVEMDPLAAVAVQDDILLQDLQIVGWYHSHPKFANTPSILDIESQVKQQQTARGKFLGAIVSPFWSASLPPLCLFTVEEDLDHLSTYNHFPPCAVRFSLFGETGRDLILEIAKQLIETYSEHPQRVSLDAKWSKGKTYGEKVRSSTEELVGAVLAEEICRLLYQAWGDEVTPLKQRKLD